MKKEFERCKEKALQVDANIRRAAIDILTLRNEVGKYDQICEEMKKMIDDFEFERNKIVDVQKRMDDCMIPINVQRRRVDNHAEQRRRR